MNPSSETPHLSRLAGPVPEQDENGKSMCVVFRFFSSEIIGGLFEFKVRQGGEIVYKREKEGPDEVPLLEHVASFFNCQGLSSRNLQCERFGGSSMLYLLLDAGPKFSHSLEGIMYDTQTGSYGSFKRPLSYKPSGTMIYAYGKLYYITDPSCHPNIPTPSFERYDPVANCWESLTSFPYYGMNGLQITGYVVFRGCIFFSFGIDYRYKFLAFHISTQQWHDVKASHSELGYVCYSMTGRGVVVGDTVYTVANIGGQVLSLSFEMESSAAYHFNFFVRMTLLPEVEIKDPASPFCMLRTISMVHLGSMEFCIVQTGFTTEKFDRQHLCITTFQIVAENTSDVHIKTLYSTICEVSLPGHGAYIVFAFTPDCEDVESEDQWILNETLDADENDTPRRVTRSKGRSKSEAVVTRSSGWKKKKATRKDLLKWWTRIHGHN